MRGPIHLNHFKVSSDFFFSSGVVDYVDTPLISRFAKFVTSGQHIPDDEVRTYEDDPSPWLTENSEDEEENGSNHGENQLF